MGSEEKVGCAFGGASGISNARPILILAKVKWGAKPLVRQRKAKAHESITPHVPFFVGDVELIRGCRDFRPGSENFAAIGGMCAARSKCLQSLLQTRIGI